MSGLSWQPGAAAKLAKNIFVEMNILLFTAQFLINCFWIFRNKKDLTITDGYGPRK